MMTPAYLSDLPWMHLYRPSLSPQFVHFTMGLNGLEPPPMTAVCELAYGQGVSLVIHAAANQDSIWSGTDFNADHARFAAELSRNIELDNLVLHNLPLSQYCANPMSPPFDLVVTLGTWSWLPPQDQAAILRLLESHLRPDAIVGLDYSTLPGGAATANLMRVFSALAGPGTDSGEALLARIPGLLQQTLDFFDVNPSVVNAHWELRGLVEKLREDEPSHVAHEYFNCGWWPRYFSDMAQLLRTAGLRWACSWDPGEAVEDLHLTPQQQRFLSTIADVEAREQLRDFVLGRSRRDDLWSRGDPAVRHEPEELLGPLRVILVGPAGDFDYSASSILGELALSRDLYGGLLDALADHQPKRIRTLLEAQRRRATPRDTLQALAILVGSQMIQVVNPSDAEIGRSLATTAALNRNILTKAREDDVIGHLAAPLTGAGIKVPRTHRLFLLARAEGARRPSAYVAFARDALIRDGSASPERVAKIESEAEDFELRFLPIYRALMITDQG